MRRTRRIAAGAVTAFAAVSLAAGGLTVAARAATESPQAILYAAPSGTGAACSVTQPCSITAAKQAVERLDRQMTGNIDVDLLGGTYHVPGGLRLGVADSGTSGHDVVWRAAPGQHPVISGAVRVAGFTEYDKSKDIWRARVGASAAKTAGQQLFVDGQRAQLARSAGSPAGVQVTATGFGTTDPAYASFTGQDQIEVVQDNDWKHVSCPVQSITPAADGGSAINILPSCWDANHVHVPNLGFPYNGAGLPAMSGISYVENAYQLLTQPGQFYLDKSGGYLYYIPRPGQNLKAADVELPVDQSLLTASGTPGHLAPVNQDDSGAAYAGGGWHTYTSRGLGDLGNDVAATSDDGDSVSYTFTGTGLEVLGETNSDEGPFDVYVDGKQDTTKTFTENTSGSTRLAQQVIYEVNDLPKGTHTVKIVKNGGTYLTIEGFEVIPDAPAPVSDIAFTGIDFEYTTWNLPVTTGYIDNQAGILWDTSGATPVPAEVPAAVTVSRGDHVTFTRDAFEHLGGAGVNLADGTQNSGVYRSVITDTAGGGVSVGEVDDYFQDNTALMTAGDTVADNSISYVGQGYDDTVGVWAGYTRGLTVTHNDIAHTTYSGMSLGWGWGYASPCSMQAAQGLSTCAHGTNYAGGNAITGNYIHDVMNVLYDGGPIYTNGGQFGDIGSDGQPVQSVLSGNYLSVDNHGGNMIYHDEGSSNWHTYDNVINFAAGANWLSMWTPTINHIDIGTTYTSTSDYGVNGTDITLTPPVVVSGGNWPPAAQAIMNAAGLGLTAAGAKTVIDDDSQALTYVGDWNAQGSAADQGDTHTTSSQGASVTLSFTGTSVAFVADKGPGGGTASVTIDGKSAGTVDTTAPFDDPDQTVFTDASLSAGKHTITVTDQAGGLTVGSFQTPARPYLTVTTADPYPTVGSRITVTAAVGNPARRVLPSAKVTLLAPAGWAVSNPVRLAPVAPGRTATATFTATPPSQETPGTATFSAVAAIAGQSPMTGTARIESPYDSLPDAFNDVGISADNDTGAANIDGSGYSFSATALAAAGVTPGATVTAGGLSFTWPSSAAGAADNVVASGQAVTVNATGGTLGFLDTATYGPSSGTGVIVYADGSTQSFTLTVPDWYSGPPSGQSAAITTAYRNAPGNGRDNHPVYIYEQSVPLDSSKEVTQVVLPNASQGLTAGSAATHIFAITIG